MTTPLDWNDLRVFLIAVRAGSYQAAAGALGMNRTTVGRRVAALEAALGVTLFRHTPTGPEPTWEGRRVLDAAARMEADAEALGSELAAGPQGPSQIRVASSAGLAVEFMDLLADFQAANRDVGIELLGALDPLEAVSQRRADLAVAVTRVCPRRMAGVRVGPLPQALYARKGATTETRLAWGHEMLAALPGPWTAANPAPDGEARPAFNNWPQLKQAVLDGVGAASLWCFAADRETDLVRLAEPDARLESALWLLHRSDAPLDRATLSLISFLDGALRARLET